MDAKDFIHESTLKIISMIAPYGLIVSLLYLWGYWSSFGINILEFISLSDVIKISLYPLAVGVASSVVGYFIRDFFPSKIKPKTEGDKIESNEDSTVQSDKRATKFKYVLLKTERFVPIATLLIIACLWIFVRDPGKWIFIDVLLFSLFLFKFNEYDSLFKNVIPHDGLRRTTLPLMTLLLFISFGLGKANADKIIKGTQTTTINTKILREKDTEAFSKKHLLENQDKLKFIGMAGDYFFFLSMDNTKTYVVKYSDLHFLEFNNFD